MRATEQRSRILGGAKKEAMFDEGLGQVQFQETVPHLGLIAYYVKLNRMVNFRVSRIMGMRSRLSNHKSGPG